MLPTSAPEGCKEPNIARVDNKRAREDLEGGSLSIKEHQKFIKRLRKHIKQPVRFYMCGEYGKNLKHPHYHYLIFGYNFPDKKYKKKSKSGTPLYQSETLDKLWGYGHAWIGDVTYETCAYVAGYIMKKIRGDKAHDHYRRTDEAGNDYWLKPEFNLMSRNPGIARDWWEKYSQDVITQDGVFRYGTKMKPPRYYDKLLELMDPQMYAAIKNARMENAREHAADSTPQRLLDREVVQQARINLKKRQLES